MNRLLRLSDEKYGEIIHSEFKEDGGAYRVFVVDQNQNPISLSRFIDSDDKGTLYIGKAARFVNRAIDLKKSTDPKYKSSGHEFGVRFKELLALSKDKEFIPNKLRYENLFIELIVSENPAEKEKFLLNSYFELFGELPPFNRVS